MSVGNMPDGHQRTDFSVDTNSQAIEILTNTAMANLIGFLKTLVLQYGYSDSQIATVKTAVKAEVDAFDAALARPSNQGCK